MKEYKVPVQSLIDHIKTATDVDPWAKEMAEELLKEQEAVEPIYIENPYTHLPVSYCSKCREPINKYIAGNPYRKTEYCHYCGQAVKWDE
jgi:hypothetical protein